MIYEINAYLREKRIEAGLTQDDLSKVLGYSNSQFISNVENNKCFPSLRSIKLWAKFIKADPKKCAQMLLDEHKLMIIEKTGINF